MIYYYGAVTCFIYIYIYIIISDSGVEGWGGRRLGWHDAQQMSDEFGVEEKKTHTRINENP